MGTSPASLKFRRRSTIGLRGSPENNSLIRYLAQQRSSRQKEAFTQISPFKPANVRSLKDKIDAFQASFESLQEAEGEPSKEGDSSQDKTPFKKEPNLEQWNEKFMLGNRGAALKENLSENGSKSSRRELSILSPQPAVTATAAKKYSNSAFDRGDESAAVSSCVKTFEPLQTDTSASQSSRTPKKKKVTFGDALSPEIFDQSLPANTPLRRGASPGCAPQSPWGSLQGRLRLRTLKGAALEPQPQRVTKPEGDKDTEDGKATENPKRSKIQRQKNPTTTAPRRPRKQNTQALGEEKEKVMKCLYGEREMASKKPLLSPIPEIPELFSFVSSPSSPLLTEGAGLAEPTPRGACRARDTPRSPRLAGSVPGGSVQLLLQGAAGTAQFSNAVPDAGSAFDTSEYFQQGEEAPCETETKESSSLLEKEGLPGNLLAGMEIVQEDPVRADPARRRRRSSTSFPFPPAEKLEISEADVAVCSYSLEQVLAGSLQGCRSSRASTELRVRRSMRLSRGAATEGLAWVQLPPELPKQPPRGRRSSSSSILAGAENIHPREQNLLPLAAPGKENEGSAPARRMRRRSLCEATAPEMPQAPNQRRRSTNSVCRKDSRNQNHSEAAETLELRLKDVSGISDFLK
ncbi:LOW QUALITY PROTEIN: cell division cycle-associated protein 2 [Catharus ustulatus]|uniref:LOW QUALITY PROTEIN: cell division cycle-associated protein 2 n=1 Tax=Catharus ustulatus TaxID=91951 RepID=UPI00140B8D5E|nr:LOW QUALITY PROTEIN: cell division cycle-associated protein 2 [Catharus ustulatus]